MVWFYVQTSFTEYIIQSDLMIHIKSHSRPIWIQLTDIKNLFGRTSEKLRWKLKSVGSYQTKQTYVFYIYIYIYIYYQLCCFESRCSIMSCTTQKNISSTSGHNHIRFSFICHYSNVSLCISILTQIGKATRHQQLFPLDEDNDVHKTYASLSW